MKMNQKRKKVSLKLNVEVLKSFKFGEKAVHNLRNLSSTSTTIRIICNKDVDKTRRLVKTATSLQSIEKLPKWSKWSLFLLS